ncbi:MAG: tRNA (adenosine(37)-N6)-dimethylallyltransferase MiaA [Spirochaetaceae bacterium]
MPRPRVLCLFGPTAVGKTDVLLRRFSGCAEVISADSMQVYRHLDIGTAKPGPAERAALAHHLIDIRNPDEQYHAGEFVTAAEELVPEIAARGRLPIIAGGTAFYFRNFVFGLPGTPKGTPAMRARLRARLEAEGADALYAELGRVDPPTAGRISPNDTYRILRALEVYAASGRPLSSFHVPQRPRADFEVMLVGLWRDRGELAARIEKRVAEMMAAGLPAEVEAVCRMGYGPTSPGLRGIGYREFFSVAGDAACSFGALDGDRLALVAGDIERSTRRYAKRQMTFFRRLPGVRWIEAGDDAALDELASSVA